MELPGRHPGEFRSYLTAWSPIMSQRCDICGKSPGSGHNVSHSNRKTKRRFMPNLQSIRVWKGETVVRQRLCTRCLRSGCAIKPPSGRKTSVKPAPVAG